MAEFERRVRAAPDGLPMSWPEIHRWGTEITQAIDCEIAAFRVHDDRVDDERAVVRICAIDSTEWVVAVDESAVELRSVLGAVRRLASGAG